MHELQHIAGDETLDVKILYVVRDPAGMNQSLIKSKKSTELEAYCYQELLQFSNWQFSFSFQKISSSLVSLEMVFEALQSELFRFKIHTLTSKIIKIPEFNLFIKHLKDLGKFELFGK